MSDASSATGRGEPADRAGSCLPETDGLAGTGPVASAYDSRARPGVPDLELNSTLGDLPLHPAAVDPAEPLARAVAQLQRQPELPGLIAADRRGIYGAISRRALQAAGCDTDVTLAEHLDRIEADTLILPAETRIRQAAEELLLRSPQQRYEPIVVRQADQSLRLLSADDVLAAHARLLDLADEALRRKDQAVLDEQNQTQLAEANYKLLVENAAEGIALLRDGVFLYVNPSLADSLGTTAESLADRPLADLLDTDAEMELPTCLLAEGKPALSPASGECPWVCLRSAEGDRRTYRLKCTEMQWQGEATTLALFDDQTEQLQADAALRQSRRRLKELFENARDAILWTDLKSGQVLNCNRAAAEMLERPRGELIGRDEATLFGDGGVLASQRQNLLTDGASEAEAEITTATGRQLTVRVSASVTILADRPTVQVILHDITDLKRAEREIHNSQKALLTILDALPAGVVLIDRNRHIRRVNQAALKLLGCQGPEELIGQACRKALCGNRQGPCPRDRGESCEQEEHELLTRDGRKLQVLKSTLPVQLGREEMILETLVDITERRRALDALRTREEQLRLFVEHTPAAVAMFDNRMWYLVASRRWIDDHGLGGQPIVGRDAFELSPDSPDHWRQAFADALAGQVVKCDEEQLPADDGQGGDWVRWEVHPWRDESDRVGGVIKFSEVITDRKWAEEALKKAKAEAERASRLKSAFLANVSHEIRTPINGIIGFAESILHSIRLSAAHRQARTILSESEHLLGLINTLLDHAKIEAGRLEIEFIPVDLHALMESVVSGTNVHAAEKGLDLHTAIDPQVPRYALSDPLRLRQVLLNLVSNAIKFTDAGSVTVRIEPEGMFEDWATLRFSVTDTGVGVPPEKQATIFDSFSQADGSTTRKYGGTGLGTTICKQIVDIMGGQMGVQSQVGTGSTFWFTVDLGVCAEEEARSFVEAESGQDRRQLPKPQRSCLTGARILVAEDYPTNREVVQMHLGSVGALAEVVEDGQLAIDACRQTTYDLILLDVQMPNVDGLDAARAIRQMPEYAERPIVALTANAEVDTRLSCLQAGMNDVVTKPVRRDALLTTLSAWLSDAPPPDPLAAEDADALDGMAAPSPAPAEPMDYDQAVAEFGGATELLAQVLEGFFEQCNHQVPILEQAADDEDLQTLRAEAHKMRGGAANLTASALADVAAAVEEAAKARDTQAAVAGVPAILQQLERLKSFCKQRT